MSKPSKRSFDDHNDQDGGDQNGGDQRRRRIVHTFPPQRTFPPRRTFPPHRIYRATKPGVTRLYAFHPKKTDNVVVDGKYTNGILLDDFVCANNPNRPCFSAFELGISPEDFLCGIAYSVIDRPVRDTDRQFSTELTGIINIADVQSSVTGSITAVEMAPFVADLERIRVANPEAFYANPMQSVIDGCGERRDTFVEMLRREAQREIFEETRMFVSHEALEQVRIINNWMVFKVHISNLRHNNEGCRAFALARGAPDDFFAPPQQPRQHGKGIPFKVQIWIYGSREEFKERWFSVRCCPFVRNEKNLAGLVIYDAADVEQFRVGDVAAPVAAAAPAAPVE